MQVRSFFVYESSKVRSFFVYICMQVRSFFVINMYREAINELIKWKESKRRKPLVLEGARQVGKTWLVKEFARLYYKNIAYVNFEEQQYIRSLAATTWVSWNTCFGCHACFKKRKSLETAML